MKARLNLIILAAALTFAVEFSAYAAPSFTGIGDLAGGNFQSVANGVSGNGLVVVGNSSSDTGYKAISWTANGGFVNLGANGNAQGVSNDGSIVVGSSGSQAFRWSAGSGIVGLGDLAGGAFESTASDVSGNGSVVVGASTSTSGREAFRWSAGSGMVGLGDLAGGDYKSYASGVSGDGSVVVGYGTTATGIEAFRWTTGSGMVSLGDLAGENANSFSQNSYAVGVSEDGSVVVGYGTSDSGQEAFRWTASGGMVGLGDLAGGNFQSVAYDSSDDGSVVVGFGISASGYEEAFIWEQGSGMHSLKDLLTTVYGLDLGDWRLGRAYGVSADGQIIVGTGSHDGVMEGWVIDLNLSPVPEPTSVWMFGCGLLVLLWGVSRRKAVVRTNILALKHQQFA